MFLFIDIRGIKEGLKEYLNTSHVLIYQEVEDKRVTLLKFKYISCSYLSEKVRDTAQDLV